MLDWGLPLSQYSQQCQACFAPQSGSGLDIVQNTEQGRQANQCRYPRPERRYSVFRNHGTVASEFSQAKIAENIGTSPSYVNKIIRSKEQIMNKTFLAMMEDLGFDVELNYVERKES